MKLNKYDNAPMTPYDLFQIDNRLSDAEMQYIKMVYVNGKSVYKMPNGESKKIIIK